MLYLDAEYLPVRLERSDSQARHCADRGREEAVPVIGARCVTVRTR